MVRCIERKRGGALSFLSGGYIAGRVIVDNDDRGGAVSLAACMPFMSVGKPFL